MPIEASAPAQLAPLEQIAPAQQARPELPDLTDIGLVPPEPTGNMSERGVSAAYAGGSLEREQLLDLAVLGIQPLDDLREARALLDEAGFDNCEQKGGLLTCTQNAEGLSDSLKIGFVNEGGKDKIHT